MKAKSTVDGSDRTRESEVERLRVVEEGSEFHTAKRQELLASCLSSPAGYACQPRLIQPYDLTMQSWSLDLKLDGRHCMI